jgi:hypothetical protein
MIRLYKEGKATLFHPDHGVVIANAKDMKVKCDAALCIGRLEDDRFIVNLHTDKTGKTNCSPDAVPSTPSYAATVANQETTPTKASSKTSNSSKAMLQFKRLGLASPSRILEIHKRRLAYKIDLPSDLTIGDFSAVQSEDAFHQARSRAKAHHNFHSSKKTGQPFAKLWFDIKSVSHPSYSNCSYFIVIVCDYTRWKACIPLTKKSQLTEHFQTWYSQFVLPLGYKTNFVRCDNGGEQKSVEFSSFLTKISAMAEYTNAYSSASNGVAERAIQTIFRTANAIRFDAHLPKKAWAECVRTACFLENRLPTEANPNKISPFEMLYRVVPDLSILRVIGCKAYVHEFRPKTLGLDPKATVGTLIGYAGSTNGYRILINATSGAYIESAHVTFAEQVPNLAGELHSLPGPTAEHIFYSYERPTKTISGYKPSKIEDNKELEDPDPEIELEEDHVIEPDQVLDLIAPELRPPSSLTSVENVATHMRPHRGPKPIDRLTYPEDHRQPRRSRANLVHSASIKTKPPKIKYQEAVKDPLLQAAMYDEIKNLIETSAFKVVDLPPGRRAISSIWAHKLKYDENGKFIRARSRICPRGYEQTANVDYDPNHVASPTLSLDTAMLSLSIEVQRAQFAKLADVPKAFGTYTEPEHDIYLRPPSGMVIPPGKVLLLLHSWQGTRQGAYDWHKVANKTLLETGKFKRSAIDPCYYYRWDGDCFTQVGLYVDDFRVASDQEDILNDVISMLEGTYSVKVSAANWWLGMGIEHDRRAGILTISMRQAILGMLDDFGMTDCKSQPTPAAPNTKLHKPLEGSTDPEAASFPYREAVGGLLWIARTGRPDILYAVCQLTQFSKSWDSTHVIAAKYVLRYLKGTMDICLTLRKADGFILEAFADSDYGAEPEGNNLPMRSISGMVAYLHGVGPIFSSASLEKTLSLSTAEAEYKATSKAAQYLVGIRQLMEEIGFPQTGPSTIYNDNAAAVIMVRQNYSSSATRHIKLKFHYIREKVSDGEIEVKFCPTTRMIADIMTKSLDRVKFARLRDLLMSGKMNQVD